MFSTPVIQLLFLSIVIFSPLSSNTNDIPPSFVAFHLCCCRVISVVTFHIIVAFFLCCHYRSLSQTCHIIAGTSDNNDKGQCSIYCLHPSGGNDVIIDIPCPRTHTIAIVVGDHSYPTPRASTCKSCFLRNSLSTKLAVHYITISIGCHDHDDVQDICRSIEWTHDINDPVDFNHKTNILCRATISDTSN